ncbi:unnamed protein product [Pleuronectes platessa]|uniref:Uncharacterized protein n=1 Tax=Pleuronectes platessa TaxID=8262 RepID=A0A9N7TKZ9_PLEPL|nr:unnamed protein product [Pleuronectes platessa]
MPQVLSFRTTSPRGEKPDFPSSDLLFAFNEMSAEVRLPAHLTKESAHISSSTKLLAATRCPAGSSTRCLRTPSRDSAMSSKSACISFILWAKYATPVVSISHQHQTCKDTTYSHCKQSQ